MTNIIPIEEKIGKNVIIRYDDQEGLMFKWFNEIPGYYECIYLDKEGVINLIKSMKNRGLI